MKIKELKEFLNSFPEDTEIGIITPDSSGHDATIESLNINQLEIAEATDCNLKFLSTINSSWKNESWYKTIKDNPEGQIN